MVQQQTSTQLSTIFNESVVIVVLPTEFKAVNKPNSETWKEREIRPKQLRW